jgi:hypothetical protein
MKAAEVKKTAVTFVWNVSKVNPVSDVIMVQLSGEPAHDSGVLLSRYSDTAVADVKSGPPCSTLSVVSFSLNIPALLTYPQYQDSQIFGENTQASREHGFH